MPRFQKNRPPRKNTLFAASLFLAAFWAISPNASLAQLNKCLPIAYWNYVGVREQGNNAGQVVEHFLATTGLGPGYPWCAAFVATVLTECGIPNPKSAWSPAYFPASKIIYQRGKEIHLKVNPQPGDVFGLYFASKKRIAHVGFVDYWGDSIVLTVEGNTNQAGSRDGDGVYRKRRLKRQIYQVSRWTK